MKTEATTRKTVSDGHKEVTKSFKSRAVSDFLNVTWRMTIPTVLGIAVGMGIDGALGSSPVGFLVGAVLGFFAGIYMALKLLKSVGATK